MSLKPGQYKAVPSNWGFSKTPEKGTEQIFVEMLIDAGESTETLTWFGYFTDKAKDRTIETIYKLGFNGDFDGLASGHDTKALDISNQVMVTIENDTYDGKETFKIKWINAIGEQHGIKRLDKAEAMAIINKFKGDIISKKPVSVKKNNTLDLT
jgi:hypothetical protein